MEKTLQTQTMNKIYKIPTADGIRGLAVLIVISYHAFGNIMISKGAYSSRTGIFGVILFFILSSFLLSNKFTNDGFGIKQLISYSLGRFIRIIPLFFIASYVYYQLDMIDVEKLTSVISFKSNYAHLWTIPLEFKFYFILPIIVYFCTLVDKKLGRFFLLIFIFAFSLLSYIPILNRMGVFDRIWTPVFIMGIALCFIFKSKNLNLKSTVSDASILICILLMVFMTPAMQFFFFGYRPQLSEGVILMWATITTVFCYLCLCSTGIFSSLLKSTFLTFLGKWSFSIYLFHWAVIMISASYQKNNISVFIFSVVQSIGVGAAIYYLVEAPLEKFRHTLMNAFLRKKLAKEQQEL